MNKSKEEMIKKIKKLLAVAEDPSASDQEVQLASYRANKYMLEYKINQFELYGLKNDGTAIYEKCAYKACGYNVSILNVLVKNFRCTCTYEGKLNSDNCEFVIYGLQEDVELCMPIANCLLFYINSRLRDIKECYIGYVDFRVYKKNYIIGFSHGLKNQSDKALLELNINKKYELAITTVPAAVKKLLKDNGVENRKVSINISDEGYELGLKHGSSYELDKKDLLV